MHRRKRISTTLDIADYFAKINMSYFIVLHGPLGSGKSTNAENLAVVLGGHCISLDKALEDNDLDHPEPDAGIPASNFITALDSVLPTAKHFLENGKIVIFDGCFYHPDVLEYLIQNLAFPHYIFTLKVPIEICIKRDRARAKTLGEDTAMAVHSLVSGNDFGVLIDASTSLAETQQAILSHLPLL